MTAVGVTVSVPTTPATDGGTCYKICNGIKNAAIWLGRKIVIFWNDYLLPALKVLGAFMRTGFGIATIAAITGVSLLALAHGNYKPGCCLNQMSMRITLNILGILCFVGAGAALVAGTTVLI
jgi:hypothetical protein